MKTRDLLLALGCTAAFTACTNNDELNTAIAPEANMRTVTLSVDVNEPADTRVKYTNEEGTYKFAWLAGDKLNVYYNDGTEEKVAEFIIDPTSIDGKKADFTGELPGSFTGDVTIAHAGVDFIFNSSNKNLILSGFNGQTENFESDLAFRSLLVATAEVTEASVLPNVKLNHALSYLRLKTNLQVTQDDLQISGAEDDPELRFEFDNIPYCVKFSSTGYQVVETGPAIVGIFVTDGQLDRDCLVPIFVGSEAVSQPLQMKGRLVYGEGDFIVESEVVSQPEFTYEPGKIYVVEASNENWLPVNVQPIAPAAKEPLTIEPVSSDIEITITNPLVLDIDYRVVNSDNTIDISGYSGDSSFTIPLKAGQRLQLFGDNATYFSNNSFTNINCSGPSKVYGNIMSLINSDNYSTLMELPTTDSEGKTVAYTFAGLFLGDTGLTDASGLLLPATTLTEGCYTRMFDGCNALTTAPALPATTLTVGCYYSMFYGCTSLTTAPQLPANTLKNNCYRSMFFRCTSLTTAPELPATTLAEGCYDSIFYDCTSLTSAPELPATTLARSCYYNMFNGCTSLTTAPELKASTLAPSCYGYMFAYCNSLTTAPELPATITIGAEYCYAGMFNGCKSLTKAPELKTEILVEGCYYNMFRGCSKLSAVTCLAANISATDCTTDWLEGVAVSGTFTKASSMMSWETGASGIPSGWTVANY